jgi:outer membrane protein assembly factor BamB
MPNFNRTTQMESQPMPCFGRVVFALFIVSATYVCFTTRSSAGDWPTFRGADRSAVAKETGLLEKWPAEGPPVVWKAEGAGRGYSSLAVAGHRVFTLGDAPSVAEDEDEYLVSFDRDTGKVLWHSKTGEPWAKGKETWQSSRSTPTVDGDRVYVLTAFGELICFDAADGSEKWRKSLPDDFGGEKADNWGYSESVLVDGDRVVCTPGGPEATMVALDKESGELVWKATRPDEIGAGHSSIVISEVGGTRVYVQATGSGPLGVRASDGKVLWSYPIEKTTAVIPTPIVRGDLVFYSIGYKRGGVLLQQIPGDDGQVEIKEIYPLDVKLANKHGGVVLVGDHVYGDSDDAGILWCAELMTGEIVWKKRGSGKGSASVAAADGKLYIHFADGTMVLALADPKEYVEISSFTVPGSGDRPSWSHPVIVDGSLYVREQDQIVRYDIKAHDEPAAAGK